MLTEIYIEALLVDEELADQVWELWADNDIDGQLAALPWVLLSNRNVRLDIVRHSSERYTPPPVSNDPAKCLPN